MGHVAFIHDKLDIKFLILYIASRLIEPVGIDVLTDLALCDEGVDYFSFSECLNELVESEHIKKTEDGLYCATPRGIRNSEICESSIPYSVRIKADKNISIYNQKLKRKGLVRSAVNQRPNGTYTVTLSLSDDVDNVMTLDLMVAKEEMAEQLAEHFQAHAEEIYNNILDALLQKYQKTINLHITSYFKPHQSNQKFH